MRILDMCCGSKMFWFDKNNPLVDFCDIRDEQHILCDERELIIKPDYQCDFRELPFSDSSYEHIVFDPPHLNKLGQNSWMAKKYGVLGNTWEDDLSKGFNEAFRVLKPGGTLIFKWNETQITTKKVLSLSPYRPMYGHPSGKRSNTHWICFFKDELYRNQQSKPTSNEGE